MSVPMQHGDMRSYFLDAKLQEQALNKLKTTGNRIEYLIAPRVLIEDTSADRTLAFTTQMDAVKPENVNGYYKADGYTGRPEWSGVGLPLASHNAVAPYAEIIPDKLQDEIVKPIIPSFEGLVPGDLQKPTKQSENQILETVTSAFVNPFKNGLTLKEKVQIKIKEVKSTYSQGFKPIINQKPDYTQGASLL